MEEKLELRMYGMVPYQLTGMQGGIQHGHSAIEYSVIHGNTELFKDWYKNWKTFIVLNGGTTNTNPERLGTLNKHLETIKEIGIDYTEFYEPDLGDQLTAVTFILDERVFDRRKYPDFRTYLATTLLSENQVRKKIEEVYGYSANPNLPELFVKEYQKWVEFVGGEANVKLRDFVGPFRLA